MNYLYDSGNIIACSTSFSENSAISIIRLSGQFHPDDFSSVLKHSQSGPIEPKKLIFSSLYLENQLLDKIMFAYFKGPNSYSGEDILELYVHGNILNVKRIIALFCDLFNFRLSHPGEFTYRALLNKKMNFLEVESLDLFLNAKSHFALDFSFSSANGFIYNEYLKLKDLFIKHRVSVELAIDFSDDVGVEESTALLYSTFHDFYSFFNRLKLRCHTDVNLLDPSIVLYGFPNAGKSSLFNLILNFDRSIVSPLAGTTRDYVSHQLNWDGIIFNFLDTAGIHETTDIIESTGISKSKEQLRNSFFSILTVNPLEPIEVSEELIIQKRPDLVLVSRSDLAPFDEFLSKFSNKYNDLTVIATHHNDLSLSLKIKNLVITKFKSIAANNPIILERHKQVIQRMNSDLDNYDLLLKSTTDFGIISSELSIIDMQLSELLGQITPDDVLNNLFNGFCIGK